MKRATLAIFLLALLILPLRKVQAVALYDCLFDSKASESSADYDACLSAVQNNKIYLTPVCDKVKDKLDSGTFTSNQKTILAEYSIGCSRKELGAGEFSNVPSAGDPCPESTKRGCKCPEITGNENTPKGPCMNTEEECQYEMGASYATKAMYSCCLCEKVSDDKTTTLPPVMMMLSGTTFNTCSTLCKATGMAIYKQLGAGRLPASDESPSASTLAQKKAADALCFTAAACTSVGGTFKPGMSCDSGKGRCVAPEPTVKLSYPIGSITSVQGLRGFLKVAFDYLMEIVGAVAAVMFVYGGFRYIVGTAAGNISAAKSIMFDATIGLILVLTSVLILRTINPATLDMSRLDVYMINKQQIFKGDYCSNITATEKPVKFADAGPPPIPIESAQFIYGKDATRCGYSYYIEGFESGTCKGSKCDNKGEICLPCSKKKECKGGVTTGYGCAEASWGGNITYKEKTYAVEIIPLVVCKKLTSDNEAALFDLGGVDDSDILGDTDSDNGTQAYTFKMSGADAVAEAQSDCNDYGGPQGIYLGVQYHDNWGIDDYAIIGKNNCGDQKFAGYQDGTVKNWTSTLLKSAYACGVNSSLIGTDNFWTLDQIKTIDKGDTIQCNFVLDGKGNTPADPRAKFCK